MAAPDDTFASLNPFEEEAQPEFEWPPRDWGQALRGNADIDRIGPDPGTQQFPPDEEEAPSWFPQEAPAPEDGFQGLAGLADPEPNPEWAEAQPWQGGVIPAEQPSLIDTDLEAPPEAPPAPFTADDHNDAPLDPYSTDNTLAQLEGMDPVAAATWQVQQEDRARQHAANLRKQAIEEDAALQQEHLDMFEQAQLDAKERTDEILREATELAQADIDDARWFKQGPLGGGVRTAFALLGAAFGGVTAARTGKNQALATIMGMVDQDIKLQQAAIRDQRADLGRQRGAVAEEYARHGDLYRASETVRIAALKKLDDRIAAEMAQYDPAGTTARRQFAMRSEVRARIEQGAANIAKQKRADALEFLKEQRAQEKHHSDLLAAQSGIRKDNALIGKSNADVSKTYAEIDAMNRPPGPEVVSAATLLSGAKDNLTWDPATRQWVPGAGASEEEARIANLTPETARTKEDWEILKRIGEARMRIAGANENEASFRGGPEGNKFAVGSTHDPGKAIRQPDTGAVWEVSDNTERGAIKSMLAAATNIRKLVDRAKILRDKYGGASELRGSHEYQELKTLQAAITMETFKAFELGAPSAGDQKLAEEIVGGKDLASFVYNPKYGLEEYANRVESKLATKMATGGYRGEYKIPREHAAIAIDKKPEELLQTVTQGFTPLSTTDPELRASELEKMTLEAIRLGKHHSPTDETLDAVGQSLREGVGSGAMTLEEANAIGESLMKGAFPGQRGRDFEDLKAGNAAGRWGGEHSRRKALYGAMDEGRPGAALEYVGGTTLGRQYRRSKIGEGD